MKKHKFIIQGMHCESCKSLVRMELEDAGLASRIDSLELLPEDRGELIISELSADEVEAMKTAVASAGYSVL